MPNYRLTCINNSQLSGSFAIYHVPPQSQKTQHLSSVAWLARPAAPGTQITFGWSTDLSFVWGERGTFGGRTVFNASQFAPADPSRENIIDFTSDPYGAPTFQNLEPGGPQGTMTIRQLNANFQFPINLGIAMGNRPIYTVNFNANITTTFIPHTDRYWVVFGDYVPGETINVESLTNFLKVDFSPIFPEQTVVMSPQNVLNRAAAQNFSSSGF
ncbi:hypothetical protein [Rhizobium sp.]|uniref:hypothetical protein n=1 Tax=Rhizobium sp. TaxID=391 RepID=UPI000E81C985|nr:hypothetical protein [Rhizobium sp.]